MAAYAALTSLKHIIHNLENHLSPPISIDKQQLRSLTEVVTFLQKFIQGYNSRFAYIQEHDHLETRIAGAAYKAEDIIEPETVDRIRSQSQSTIPSKTTKGDLYQDLQLVIEEMNQIKKVAITIRTDKTAVLPHPRRHPSTIVGSSKSSSSSSMIGSDDVLNEVLENIMGSRRNLLIIPITGMGGIDKTILAQNIFDIIHIREHFDICAWTTIFQDYNEREALNELLRGVCNNLSFFLSV